jgi:hypothetical protein
MKRGGGGNGRRMRCGAQGSDSVAGAAGRRWEAAETGDGDAPLLRCRRRKEGQVGQVGERPNGQVGWLGRLSQNLKRILFQIKIGLLNIPRLCKFVQGDLGGILIWGFF